MQSLALVPSLDIDPFAAILWRQCWNDHVRFVLSFGAANQALLCLSLLLSSGGLPSFNPKPCTDIRLPSPWVVLVELTHCSLLFCRESLS